MKKHNFLTLVILMVMGALATLISTGTAASRMAVAPILTAGKTVWHEAARPFKWYWSRMVDSKLFTRTSTAQAMTVCPANAPKDATITVAQVGTTDDFTVTIQLLGENGIDLTGVGVVDFYMSTDSAGQVLAATSTDVVALAIGTDGLAIELSSNIAGKLVSESDGDIDLAIEIADNKVAYLCLVMPDGRLIISDAMSYTA